MKSPIAITWRRLRVALTLVCAAFATACGPQMPATAAPAAQAYNLTLYGYNYSDTAISSFEVNGQGGGNVNVSSPTTGGGGGVCCITVYSPLSEAQMVTIKWSRDVETWCEQSVRLSSPLPAKPEYFEVHFYQDGHIELAITEEPSLPRLRMERAGPGNRHSDKAMNVNNDSKLARCKFGYH